MSYITSYETTQRPIAARHAAANGTEASTDATLVWDAVDIEKEKGLAHAKPTEQSAWEGKPNGTAYDRREELTEEDEDMWARMAM